MGRWFSVGACCYFGAAIDIREKYANTEKPAVSHASTTGPRDQHRAVMSVDDPR